MCCAWLIHVILSTVILCLVEDPEFEHFAYIVLFSCCFQDNLLLTRTKAEYMHKGQGGIPGTFCLVFTFIARVEVIFVYKSSIFSAFVAYFMCFFYTYVFSSLLVCQGSWILASLQSLTFYNP